MSGSANATAKGGRGIFCQSECNFMYIIANIRLSVKKKLCIYMSSISFNNDESIAKLFIIMS